MAKPKGSTAPKGVDGKPVDESENPSANSQHNMKARADVMREVAADLDSIDEQRADLNESAGESRKRLKENGISKDEFEFARKMRKKKAEDRENYIDNLRESMGALGIGVQGSFFADENDAAAAKPPAGGNGGAAPHVAAGG